jgi:hypothetical protein
MKRPYERTANRKDWGTPPEIFKAISDRWGPFDLDVAAAPWNAICDHYLSPWARSPRSGGCVDGYQDALAEPWPGVFFCNPPYGPGIESWLAHGYSEVLVGRARRGVYLLPARTDTRWFHRWAMRTDVLVSFLAGRVTFVGAPAPAPFPSCVVVFDGAAIRRDAA